MVNCAQWTVHQRIGFCTFIVLCSLGTFLAYNMDFSFNYDLFKGIHRQEVPGHIPGNGTVQAVEERQKQELATVEAEPGDPETIILMWAWPFGYRFGLDCDGFDLKGLRFTDDRSLYAKAHVVFFHHRDIRTDFSNMPKEPRPWFQKWVWWNKESPAHCAKIPQANNVFNLTCNYRLDSTVPGLYGYVGRRAQVEEDFKMPAKDKLVCWIVSNWSSNHKRVIFYNELKKYININTYGAVFGRKISSEEGKQVISSCKFYLSFENSIYKDYITEKTYNPLLAGSVPVVLGPSRSNYEEHIPASSFIHYKDFDSPQKLAERLHYLDQNQTEYMKYFTWRRNFEAIGFSFGLDVCHVYKYLKHAPGYQVFQDLNKWFWE